MRNTDPAPNADYPFVVVGPLGPRSYRTRKSAWRAMDRLDAEYGAARHSILCRPCDA